MAVLAVALLGALLMVLVMNLAIGARRKWRDVRGIKRQYWFDEWVL